MIGTGLGLPNAQAGAIGPFPHMAGSASALLGFFQMGFAALVGIAVGHGSGSSPLAMIAAIAIVALGSALAYRSEEHTSELQSLMRLSYAVFCFEKKQKTKKNN